MHKSSFRPDIQGLRAIAILGVVAFHCGIPLVTGGFVGVDIFFVLSGFLITGLLLGEAEASHRINLKQFYARRMRRLLPASAFMLLAVSAGSIAILAPNELLQFAKAARSSALYLANVFFALNSLDYFGQSVRANPLLHMWSLAVEEQFYLVCPLLMLVCLQFVRSRRVLQTVLVALTACSFACGIWQSYHAPAFAFYLLPARGWEFGLGALLNFIPSQPLPKTNYLSWAGLFAVVLAFCLIRADMPFPGWVALLPTLGTAMLIMWRADQSPSLIRAFLNSGPMQFFGDLSYSWYLWHWPFLVLAAALWPTISVPGRETSPIWNALAA